jgi:hypothetical protein
MVMKNTDYDSTIDGGKLSKILKSIKKIKKGSRKAIAESNQEFDESGDGLFKKIRRGVSKASKTLDKAVKTVDNAKKTVKKTVVKKANQFDSDVKSKNTQRVIGRYAKQQGKEGLKYIAREGIAAPISMGATYVTGNPVIGEQVGSFAADQIMSRSGADKKIDGLGFGKNVRKLTNRRRKTVSGGEIFFDDDENAEKNISGTSFRSSSGKSLNNNPRPSDKANVKDVYNEYYGKSYRGSSFRSSGGTLDEIQLQGRKDHTGHFEPGRTRVIDKKRASLYLNGKFAKDKHKIIVLSGGSFLQ